MSKLLKSLLCLALAATPFLAQASATTYNDEHAFMSAAGSVTTIDFEAQNANGPYNYEYHATLSVGDVTFVQPEGRMFVFGQSFYDTPGLTSSYLNQNCCAVSGIDVTFATPVHAIGMNIGVQNTWNSGSLDVTYHLSTGEVITTTAPMLYGTNNAMAYFGFTSDVAISSFNVNGPSQGVAIDNFSYSAAPVPEPSTYAMLGLGLLGMGLLRRRQQR